MAEIYTFSSLAFKGLKCSVSFRVHQALSLRGDLVGS